VVDVGETVTDVPVPALVPPHEPEYHCQLAPVPKEPPVSVSVVEPPVQIVEVPVIPVGATDKVFTVTVTVAQVVVLHVPE